MRFESLNTPPDYVIDRQDAIWFVVGQGPAVLVHADSVEMRLPSGRHPRELGIEPDHEHFLGLLDGQPVWAAGVDSKEAAFEGLRFESLYTMFSQVPDELWALAGKAVQIAEWHRTHQFCGRCGERTELAKGERARKCPACGLLNFPRLSPAVITAVEKDGQILLAQGALFRGPMYSVLAGFVEPGETLEECVAREIKEEVGIDVTGIHYVASQPWPFPNSLMLGFEAKWAGGEIVPDPTEIVDAKWFSPGDLPPIPGRLSIARRLIDRWLEKQGALQPQR
jgi:NAD+ diphosphatase